MAELETAEWYREATKRGVALDCDREILCSQCDIFRTSLELFLTFLSFPTGMYLS